MLILLLVSTGKPIGADLTGSFLTVFTMNGYLKIYDVSRHEPKLVTAPKAGHAMFDSFGEFIMARSNLRGSHLAATVATENLLPDGKLYLWDIEKDVVHPFDFFSAVTKNDHFFARVPVSFRWDTDDSRLIVCEVRKTLIYHFALCILHIALCTLHFALFIQCFYENLHNFNKKKH